MKKSTEDHLAQKREWARLWRLANPGVKAERARLAKEKSIADGTYKPYVQAPRDKAAVAEYHRKHRHENPHLYAAYRERNKEKIVAWRRSRKEERRVQEANRRARLRGAGGTHSKLDIESIKALQKNKCVVCRVTLVDFHVDHINPIAAGGGSEKTNLQLLCRPCNQSKSSLNPIDFMQRRGFLL